MISTNAMIIGMAASQLCASGENASTAISTCQITAARSGSPFGSTSARRHTSRSPARSRSSRAICTAMPASPSA